MNRLGDLAVESPVSVVARTPRALAVDLYEVTKPRMNFLVVVTTIVGAYIAAQVSGISLASWTLVHAVIGTTMTAAAASVFNQIVERDFDLLMRRTRNRPVAAGRLEPTEALLFGTLLMVGGVAWLTVLVNPLTAALGWLTLMLYVGVYTPMKRRSPLCTLIGAIPGAIPPVMGVTAITGHTSWLAASLFAILFVWQMPHFYALALMYRDDYGGAGFRMLPSCENGTRRTHVQIVLFMLLLIPASLSPLLASNASWLYGIGAVLLDAAFAYAAYRCVTEEGRDAQRRLFLTSIAYLPLILGLLMIDQ
jgi:heme o synthase